MSLSSSPILADAPGPALASFYERHMALLGGVAYGWTGQGQPVRQLARVRQVGVRREAYFALLDDGRLLHWADDPQRADTPMAGRGGIRGR